MDRNDWRLLCRAIRSADRAIARTGRRPVYSDQRIVKMYFWSVWHVRPLRWACDRGRYGALFRPRDLPSVSQFCRRVKSPRVEAMIRRVWAWLTRRGARAPVAFLDGKVLAVSENTRDPDARTGYAPGGFARGYKLHAMVADDGRVLDYRVTPLNAGEPRVAHELLGPLGAGTLLLADGNYDSAALYVAVEERGSQLLTHMRGRRARDSRCRGVPMARRMVVELWREERALLASLYTLRGGIERAFSAMSTFGGGLGALPTWVRRRERVERWVAAKLAFYHARLARRIGLA